MKILLIVVTVILAATAAGSVFFYYDLTGQIDDLKTELAGSLEEIDRSVAQSMAETNDTLAAQIKSTEEELSTGIKDVDASLKSYSSATERQLDLLEADIYENKSNVSNLFSRIEDNEDLINSNVLKAAELYEKVKESIVMISDGEAVLGSGFIMKSGPGSRDLEPNRIVTAYHVVKEVLDNRKHIHVTFYDGKTSQAYIVAASKTSDVAILKLIFFTNKNIIYTNNMRALTAGDSRVVKPGAPVFILGSPGSYEDGRRGLGGTITTGIVSQVNRCVTTEGTFYANLIQFDAAVNFGNSGGPLFNVKGEVIGIVVSRLDPRIGDGISFAVSSNQIKRMEEIIEPHDPANPPIVFIDRIQYEYKHVSSGITLIDIPPEDVVENDNTVTAGAKVAAVVHPASTAGVKVNDIITMIDDREIRDADEFYSFLEEYYSIGDTITLEIVRGGEHVSIEVLLGEKQ